jgi:hypothetical protein
MNRFGLTGVIAAGLMMFGCGARAPAARLLDTARIERAIERSSLTQRGERPLVSCPSGVRERAGLVFTCIATVGRASTRFVVTELDGAGRVHYVAR